MQKIYYQPENAYFGDCMPFYHNGKFYVFHQRDSRAPVPFEPFEWSLAVTEDFVHYEDKGVAIAKGGEEDPDQYIYAGSVFQGEGRFHALYAVYNRNYPKQGKPSQALMRAVSDDLLHWEKCGEFFLPAPEGYDGNDWRDPYILWDEGSEEYIMILGARKLEGKKVRTGCTVWYTSKDLEHWEFQGDFWAPNLYSMHEMPDLFRIGDWWYLLTTEYSEKSKTVYRMSRSLHGPWAAPKDDAFDGRAYYAARSAASEQGRFLFGWVPTRVGESDMGNWHWGGTLVVLEVYQRPDGTLGTKTPDTVRRFFGEPQSTQIGRIFNQDGVAELDVADEIGDTFCYEARIRFSENTHSFGVRLYEDDYDGDAYRFHIAVSENRMLFDKTPNQNWYRCQNIGLDRPVFLEPGREYVLQLVVDGTIATCFLDGVALNVRMYQKQGKKIVLYVDSGELTIVSSNIAKVK